MFARNRQLLSLTQQVFLADPQWIAGEEGELRAAECIRLSLKNRPGEARLYPAVRIPRSESPGRSEVDFVLLTPQGLYVFEVKHWSGQLQKRSHQWIQESTHAQKAVEDPLLLTQKKTNDLRLWLQKRGCPLPSKAFHTCVILTHPDAKLVGELARNPEVLKLEALSGYLQKQIHGRQEILTDFPFHQIKAQLKQLPTWDEIEFHGGRIWRGDLQALTLQYQGQRTAFSRQSFAEAHILCPRTLWQSFWQRPQVLLIDWRGQQSRVRFDTESQLRFQMAGRIEREQISLLHIRRVTLGSRDERYY